MACSPTGDGPPDLRRAPPLEVVAVWQGAEQDAFAAVLGEFTDDTGATVRFTSTAGEDIARVLDRRLAAGDPPDVALVPQPALVQRYARAGSIVALDEVVGEAVRADWAQVWQELGTVDGQLFAVWFKAAHKSLLWYSLAQLEELGTVPPTDLGDLHSLVGALEQAGVPAFSVATAPSDAWTLTDWFENLYLALAGPERYDAIAQRRLPWTDPSVGEALRAMARLLSPASTVAVDGAGTTFPASAAAVFDSPPAAAMVMEGDFVPGVVAGLTRGEVGIDVDAVAFPGVRPDDRNVVGGGDAVVLFRDTPAGRALVEHLASPEAAEVWAGLGGFVSPNQSVDLAAYRDPLARRIARSLLEAGDGFRFDLSDQQPVELGGTTDAGMWGELARFVADPSDVEVTMARLEAVAAAAWG